MIDLFEHLLAGWLAGQGRAGSMGSWESLLDIYCGQLVFVTTVSISPLFFSKCASSRHTNRFWFGA